MAPAEGDALLAGALEIANRLGDPVLRCLILAVTGARKFVRGEVGDGVAIMVDNARLADQLREPGLMAGVWSCAWAENRAEGLRLADRAIERCHGDAGVERVGYSALDAGLLAWAELLARMGRLGEAKKSVDQALALVRKRAESELIVRALGLYPRLALYVGGGRRSIAGSSERGGHHGRGIRELGLAAERLGLRG